MKKFIAVLGYLLLTLQQRSDFAKRIVKAMTGNAFFPTPPITLDDVQKKAELLETQFNASRDCTKAQTQQMYQTDFELNVMLDFLAAYVTYTANTSDEDKREEIIVSAAMRSKKQSNRGKQFFKVDNTAVPGEVELKNATPGTGRVSFNWEYKTGEGDWVAAKSTTDSKTTISGLTPGLRYSFRGSTTKGQITSPYTDIVSLIVT